MREAEVPRLSPTHEPRHVGTLLKLAPHPHRHPRPGDAEEEKGRAWLALGNEELARNVVLSEARSTWAYDDGNACLALSIAMV